MSQSCVIDVTLFPSVLIFSEKKNRGRCYSQLVVVILQGLRDEQAATYLLARLRHSAVMSVTDVPADESLFCDGEVHNGGADRLSRKE